MFPNASAPNPRTVPKSRLPPPGTSTVVQVTPPSRLRRMSQPLLHRPPTKTPAVGWARTHQAPEKPLVLKESIVLQEVPNCGPLRTSHAFVVVVVVLPFLFVVTIEPVTW